MDQAKKRDIMDDLDTFRNSREFYRRAGKPWKRGYLLYGPPGTGKSSMIVAMANYLNYDIYDIELTMVHSNNDLRCSASSLSRRLASRTLGHRLLPRPHWTMHTLR